MIRQIKKLVPTLDGLADLDTQNLYATFAAGFPPDRGQPLLTTRDGDSFSYADAERESARLAHFLSDLGLVAGDRVTVQAPKSPQTVWLYLACLRGAFVYHPLNDAYREAELEYFVADAQPGVAVCAPRDLDMFSRLTREQDCQVLTLDENSGGSLAERSAECTADFDIVPCTADTVAVLLYSSGTTGDPKGAMLTHGNLGANTQTLIEAWGFTAADRLLHVLPIYHAHGLFVALGCVMLSGASMLFLPKFDARDVIGHLPGATVMMGVPTYYTRLLDEPEFDREVCASMRLFVSGSAPLLPETHLAFQARTGHTILERYGMTETLMNSSNPLNGERRPGSVGRPLPGVAIRIATEDDRPLGSGTVGEIQVKGPNVFIGYRGMPDKTAREFTADGFFRTGDQGMLSDDGYLSILGRNKDMIITGGLNVYPREVERVIDALAGVAESAVVGVPHPDFGEAVIAIVVTKPGNPLTDNDVIGAASSQLANFKVPKRVFFTEELPRNTMSKLQKNELRKQFNKVWS